MTPAHPIMIAHQAMFVDSFIAGKVFNICPEDTVDFSLCVSDVVPVRSTTKVTPDIISLPVHTYFELEHAYKPIGIGVYTQPGNGPWVIGRNVSSSLEVLYGQPLSTLHDTYSTEALMCSNLLPAHKLQKTSNTHLVEAVANQEIPFALVYEKRDLKKYPGIQVLCDLSERYARYYPNKCIPLNIFCARNDLEPERQAWITQWFHKAVGEITPHTSDLHQIACSTDDSGSAFEEGINVLRELYEVDDYAANGRF